jgi:uncharacterized metal-binding protein
LDTAIIKEGRRMAENNFASSGDVMILACSGASNVGQLSNRAAVELTQEGFGKMFCLAGIGGGLSGFVQSAEDAPRMVAIDGCEVGCAKAIFEGSRIPLKDYIVLTSMGIEKNKNFDLKHLEVQRVKDEIKKVICSG